MAKRKRKRKRKNTYRKPWPLDKAITVHDMISLKKAVRSTVSVSGDERVNYPHQ